MKNLTNNVKSLLTNVKSSFVKPKQIFINHDGTVAESRETYKEFQRDVIRSSGFGW